MKHEFSEGIAGDGAAILRDGEPMSIGFILGELRSGEEARETLYRINCNLGAGWAQKLADCLPKVR